MSGHTRGPWMIAPCSEDAERFDVVSEYEPRPDGTTRANWIAEVDLQDESHPGENLANARLITAAPDLLEALKGMLAYYTGGRINNPANHAAQAAIAKAEGR